MTIKDWVESNPGKKIEVGAKDGCGYFYIGDAQKLIDNAEACDKFLLDGARSLVTQAQVKYRRLITKAPTTADYLDTAVRHGEEPTVAKYMDYLEKHFKKVVAAGKTLETRKADLKRLKPLMEREVVSVYMSVVDDDYMNIIVTGVERGKYWDKSEADEPFGLAGVEDEQE